MFSKNLNEKNLLLTKIFSPEHPKVYLKLFSSAQDGRVTSGATVTTVAGEAETIQVGCSAGEEEGGSEPSQGIPEVGQGL